MTEIGKRIKEIRIKRGLSQDELAESSKVNLRTIQRIENNETQPREKTLKLIYNALDIEIIEVGAIENKKIDKYQIWSLFLTSIIIMCSFMAWIYRFKFFQNGERIYRKFTGWNGYLNLNGANIYNWFLSLSAITIGLVVLAHSFKLIKYKMKYILLQLLFFFLYIYSLFGERGLYRPALFVVIIATILLVITYRKKGKKTGANTV